MKTACIIFMLGLFLPAQLYAQNEDPAAGENEERERGYEAQKKLAFDLYDAKDYAAAAEAFVAAYELKNEAHLLYSAAQAHRLADQCSQALTLYSRFLQTCPTEEHAALAERKAAGLVGRCGVEAGVSEAPVRQCPAVAPPEGESEGESENSPDVQSDRRESKEGGGEGKNSPDIQSDRRESKEGEGAGGEGIISKAPPPWYTDVLGDALVGAGAVSIGASFYLYVKAREDISAGSYGDFASMAGDARRHRWYSVGAGAAGTVLVGLGLWRYSSRGSGSSPAKERAVSFSAEGGTYAITFGGEL